MTTLTFEPLIPIALWAGMAVAGLCMLVLYGRNARLRLPRARWLAIVALMAMAVALPLVVLLNPVWIELIPPPSGKPWLNILIDDSASMATPNGAAGRTRYGTAADVGKVLGRQLRERYNIELHRFADTIVPTSADELAGRTPAGEYTDIATALREALQTDRNSGKAIVLLSDGIHNASSEARCLESARLAAALSVPIYTQVIGGETAVRDLAVEVRSPQELAFVGQIVPVRVIVQPRGLAGARARVSLWDGDRMVEQRELALASDADVEVEFPVKPERSGMFRYEIRAEPLAHEATQANNQCMYLLRVVDEPIRTLVLEGNPYWDTKFLLRTLATDQAIELTSIVRLTENRYLQRTLARAKPADAAKSPPPATTEEPINATPAMANVAAVDGAAAAARSESWKILPDVATVLGDEGSLSGYQIIVLGRDADVFLSDEALGKLRRWISRDGGSLVCFRGAPTQQINERLRQLLPVRWQPAHESRFHMQLTPGGKDLRWIPSAADGPSDALAQLPSLATVTATSDVQAQAVVWAVATAAGGGESNPAASALTYGMGRVVVIEGAGMWRWAFLAPQFQQQQNVYGSLWHSLIRWLVGNAGLLPNQKWSLRSDKIRFSTTEQATASLLVRESALGGALPTIELRSPAEEAPQMFSLTPDADATDAYHVNFGRLSQGRYEARIADSPVADPTATTIFEVRGHVDELLNLTPNAGLMAQLASISGGAVLEATAPRTVAAKFDQHLNQTRPDRVRKTSAWDRWWVMAAILALWTGTWTLRRRSGLV